MHSRLMHAQRVAEVLHAGRGRVEALHDAARDVPIGLRVQLVLAVSRRPYLAVFIEETQRVVRALEDVAHGRVGEREVREKIVDLRRVVRVLETELVRLDLVLGKRGLHQEGASRYEISLYLMFLVRLARHVLAAVAVGRAVVVVAVVAAAVLASPVRLVEPLADHVQVLFVVECLLMLGSS